VAVRSFSGWSARSGSSIALVVVQALRAIRRVISKDPLPADDSKGDGIREELLSAIASNDSARFKESATKIGQRKISAESDWCQDDYLLFLLLLGNQKFGRPLVFLSSVIEARRQNPNPIPQKINEVFAALDRGEFGIDGQFGFLKIPFLHLAGKLRLGPPEARKAIEAMSAPGLLEQISPFLKFQLWPRARTSTKSENQNDKGKTEHGSLRPNLAMIEFAPTSVDWTLL